MTAANSGDEISTTGADTDKMARRVMPADKGPRIILDGIERDGHRVTVGSDAKLMDRLYRLNPRRAAGCIARQMKALLPA